MLVSDINFKIKRWKVSVRVENGLLYIDWKGSKMTHKQRVEEITSLFELTPKLDFMLKQPTVKRVFEAVSKRFDTSYTDIMAMAVCLNSENVKPYISRCVDYDSYTDWIRVCYEKELSKHIRKYGSF